MTVRKNRSPKKPASQSPNKTAPTKTSVSSFINDIENPARRQDAKTLAKLFKSISGKSPKMWGSNIVGYGQYHYRYETGREGDSIRIGFSPRKQKLVLYIVPGFSDLAPLLARLGKHKIGKSCLYLNRIDDIDLGVLEEIAIRAWQEMEERYPARP